MSTAAIQLCRRALIGLGALPIDSFDGGTVEALTAAELYPETTDGLLASNDWHFATRTRVLTQSLPAPETDWPAAYLLPADTLRVLAVGATGSFPGLNYEVVGRHLHTFDFTSIAVRFIRRLDAAEFPPHFRIALIAQLKAEFAPAVGRAEMAEGLQRTAKREASIARAIDAQQAPARRIDSDALIEVR